MPGRHVPAVTVDGWRRLASESKDPYIMRFYQKVLWAKIILGYDGFEHHLMQLASIFEFEKLLFFMLSVDAATGFPFFGGRDGRTSPS